MRFLGRRGKTLIGTVVLAGAVALVPAASAGAACGPYQPDLKGAKQVVRADLANKLPTGSKKNDKVIEKALKAIDQSLYNGYWVDNCHLNAKKGYKVFDRERKAVKYLGKAKGLNVSSEINRLVRIDRALASIAIDEIPPAVTPKRQEKVDKETAKANKYLAKGDAYFAQGKPDKAIDNYKKAWKYAQKAIRYAG